MRVSFIEPVIGPFRRVVVDVLNDVLIYLLVFDDVVVKTGLPLEICVDFSGLECGAALVPSDDSAQIFVQHGIVVVGDPAGGIGCGIVIGRGFECGGRQAFRFVNDDNSMDVVWHDDIGIQCCVWKLAGDLGPTVFGDFSDFGKDHCIPHDVAKHTNKIVYTYGDKIRPITPIIPIRGARRWDAVFVLETFRHNVNIIMVNELWRVFGRFFVRVP